MWLERFAGQSAQSTPAGGSPNRAFSPVPRRSIQLGQRAAPHRPGLTPRTSSLGALASNGSTDSLPAAARIPNGTSLRKELNDSPSSEAQNPILVLQAIIGPYTQHQNARNDIKNSQPGSEASADDIDFGELSLEEFADAPSQIASSTESQKSQVLPVIEDFEKEKDRFEDLHNSIAACDEVLASVETYLTSFRADLAAVSSEIETLQDRSSNLNTRLQNRKVVEKVLGPEVEAFSIPPAVVRKLSEGAVDDGWIKALEELDKRTRGIEAKINEGRDIKAAQDIQPFIDEISNKAVERIRDYLVAQIKALRSPNINAQIIQQKGFVRYRGIFTFLAQRQPELANEISLAYVYTMRWYFLHNFTRYRAALEKLNVHMIEASETIAADAPKRVARQAPPHDTFSIGRRLDVLRTSNNTALPSHIVEENKEFHYLEVPFRTFNLALLDNVSAEYSFETSFFSKQPLTAINKRVNDVLQPTLELGKAFTRSLTEHSQDAIGVLLCLRLNQHFAFELQRRKVPAIDGYINATRMLLWPRFQLIMDAHCEGIRKATASLSGRPVGSALALTTSTAAAQTTAPHSLTQRFANFAQAILSLSSEAGDDEPVGNSLNRLRNDYEAFLIKLSKGIADVRKRERFLYNNYSLICTIIGDTKGKMAEDLKEHFTDLGSVLSVTG